MRWAVREVRDVDFDGALNYLNEKIELEEVFAFDLL